MKARKKEDVSAEGSGRDVQKRTQQKESTQIVPADGQANKDHTAASIFRLEELRRRIREAERTPRTRCHRCGAPDPGFLDSDDPSQSVTCAQCGDESTLARWQRAASLSDDVLSLRSPSHGYYAITWYEGVARITHREDADSADRHVATVWLEDDWALVSARDVAPHYRLLGVLNDHGITVREEG